MLDMRGVGAHLDLAAYAKGGDDLADQQGFIWGR
jgi:hypothetical protein